jgi:hypothetical protein
VKHNTITVPWQNQSDTWWTETCANIIEVFGLPGGKYTTEVSAECMHFFFKDERDAFMCKILISEEV